MSFTVVSLRRYPVKSMGGEGLDAAVLDARGIAGDRWYAVVDDEGRLASGKNGPRFRRRDAVFAYTALAGDRPGEVVVVGPDGRSSAGDPALDAELSRTMGDAVRLLPETGTPHQDSGPVSLVGTATLEWCARRWDVNADPRRLRVNVVVATDEPFVEETWVGRTLACGDARLRVVDRIPRCRMVDIDQDGATAEGRLLRHLAAERDLSLAVYGDVAVPGTIRLGDALTVL
ncbi:MOSC domain-containing protein [Nocardioides sp. zg-DK7169]|uniref:MOSC domain-containing protein n=1 Tax=Nocardioides sp. zg-DK7169 TaxID=2736600 RepID=UPI0015557C71|nr:MOSC N-terminal beta barrel domain-containing protein [Nocardioides sp. zg-DK7169]NPC95407.1 MOSC domain-containing protein [Nocardioides sp. zg-DK7169]